MAVAANSKVGHYEITEAIGAGGMGEVYRAHDPRLGRDVAVKVIPASFAADVNRLRRFEQEARAAAALSHANILAVHDIGTHDGCPYIVSELLKGQTLGDRLRDGALPIRKLVDYALQIARGLTAAHDRGIVHRDLKPDNIFITKDGRVKILDFGLAKLMRTDADEEQTKTVASDPGTVLGTVGYMSPEQVRGKEADARSDLFSFGAVLYEMISGKRAFRRDSAADTMSAILKEEPPELSATNLNVPPALERIVRHCLEKNPEERFRSAHDVAFDLEMLSSISSTSVRTMAGGPASRAWVRTLAAAAAVLGALALVFLLGRSVRPQASAPVYSQLTFKRGEIDSARFSPDGHAVVYAATWNGQPVELFNSDPQSRGSVPIGIRDAQVQAISRAGEMLILRNWRDFAGWAFLGTLARVPLTGGTPRPIMDDVQSADFTPDGNLVVIRYAGQRFRLESPPGKVLYETAGWISHVRVSPKGGVIAFIDHPTLVSGDDRGAIAVVDSSGGKKTLTAEFASAQGLAWSPAGDEVWFTASNSGNNRALYSVTTSGKQQLRASTPDVLTLHDIAHDGTVLLTTTSQRRHIFTLGPGMVHEMEIEGMDWPIPRAMTADGKYVVYDESGEGGGPNYATYLAATDGSSNVRLSDGSPFDISPDQKWVLTKLPEPGSPLMLVPTGVGNARQIDNANMDYRDAAFFADGKRIVFAGAERGHNLRSYVQDLSGGKATAITPEGTWGAILSPDGNSLLVTDSTRTQYVLSLSDHEKRPIPGLTLEDRVAGWAEDNKSVYTYRRHEFPLNVYKIDLRSGESRLLKQFTLPDVAAVGNFSVNITPDGRYYACDYGQFLSDLYVLKGLGK